MTPQLQQAIKMLQLSNMELAEFVDAEIEQNPLLDQGERESDETPIASDGSAEPAAVAVNGHEVELPDTLAGAAADAADVAEHWQAASVDGGGSFDLGGDCSNGTAATAAAMAKAFGDRSRSGAAAHSA